jgi:hypothetical protein
MAVVSYMRSFHFQYLVCLAVLRLLSLPSVGTVQDHCSVGVPNSTHDAPCTISSLSLSPSPSGSCSLMQPYWPSTSLDGRRSGKIRLMLRYDNIHPVGNPSSSRAGPHEAQGRMRVHTYME